MNVKLIAVVGLFFLIYLYVAGVVFDRFPNSGDEYSYILQAKIFSTGHLSFPSSPPEIRDFFVLDHVVDDGRVRSKYPPGWPMLLCLVEPFDLSWALNPFLSALTLYFMFHLVAQFLNRKSAWITVVITGISPFFLYNGSSFYSHTSALLFMVISLNVFILGLKKFRMLLCMLAGLAAGFTFLIRPVDGIICGAALILLAVQFKNIRAITAAAGGSIPLGIVFLLYNHMQFGGAFISGYDVYRPTLVQLIGASNVGQEFSWINVRMYVPHFKMILRFVEWSFPGTVLLFPIGVWHLYRIGTVSARRALIFGTGLLVVLFTVFQFVTSGAGDCYGPRYLFLWLMPVGLIASAGFELMFQRRRKIVSLICIILICLMTTATGVLLFMYGKQINDKIVERSRIYRLAKGYNLNRAVVFLRDTDYYEPRWYTRNGTTYRGNIVYVIDRGNQRNRQLLARYQGYCFYQYMTKADKSEKRAGAFSGENTKELMPYLFSEGLGDDNGE